MIKQGHFLLLFFFLFSFTASFSQSGEQDLTRPYLILSGLEAEFRFNTISGTKVTVLVNDQPIEVEQSDGQIIFSAAFHSGDELVIQNNGKEAIREVIHPIPGWLSILPPLIAILLALVFREVLTSLFIGILSGAMICGFYQNGFSGLISAVLRTIDRYILNALNDAGHLSVIVFSMLIGATVSIISKNGGMAGVVDKLSVYAKDRRSGQFVTWLLGVVIFFDDYANTLIVGNTMRPVTDRLRISREKLSYLVDSTAAPIAAIAFVTTWIGAELGYIQDGVRAISGLNESVYGIFISSLQYSYYPLLTLGFMLMLIWRKRDFGPMWAAEQKAISGNQSGNQNKEMNDREMQDFEPDSGTSHHWYNAVIPVVVIILGTIIGLLSTGWDGNVWHNQEITFVKRLSTIIGQADAYQALLWSSISGLLAASVLSVGQRLMSVQQTVDSIMHGFKTMLTAMIILILAWSLSGVTEDLHTASFLTDVISGHIQPFLFPATVFLLSALVSFSTGSSWGTMAILYPLMLPLSWTITSQAGMEYADSLAIFHNVVSCVLAGSVLGDHCSPISDTTILSSLASSCNHIDHVRTQLPYALTVGLISLIFGTLLSAIGLPFYICLPIGLILLYLIIQRFGRVS